MKTIGIIGFGFVGQAIYSAINDTSDVLVYDKYKHEYKDKEVLIDSEFLFVCVPTPTNNGIESQDASAFIETMLWLNESKFSGIVIIKSTVLPQFIMEWTDKLNVVANPEFLSQNFAKEDFEAQRLVLLGGDAVNCCKVRQMYTESFRLPNAEFHITSIEESMNFKYIHNIFHAYNVLYWNFVHEVFGNSRKHTELYRMLYGSKPILSQVAADGSMGYGGACFPKDVNAMGFSSPHMLTDFMRNYNEKLRK